MAMTAIILGGGAIGLAVAECILERFSASTQIAEAPVCVLTYYRHKPAVSHPNIHLYQLDATDEHAFEQFAEFLKSSVGQVDWVINTVGMLHDESKAIKPEKRIHDFNSSAFHEVMNTNVLPTLFAAKYLCALLPRASVSVFCTISAKVGSIEDNRLGGWYSYRASKACLNMMLKNLSIEFKQKNKNLCVLALHPGTTKSNLSAPFQRNVPAEKLFDPQRTARQLLDIIIKAQPDQSGSFYSWDGSQIPW